MGALQAGRSCFNRPLGALWGGVRVGLFPFWRFVLPTKFLLTLSHTLFSQPLWRE
jgi:hypothetical protein